MPEQVQVTQDVQLDVQLDAPPDADLPPAGDIDPLTLSWGAVTPEVVVVDESLAIQVFNHELATPDQLDRNLAFMTARLNYFAKHLPREMRQEVVFDDRGQDIPHELRTNLQEQISRLAPFRYMTESKASKAGNR